MLNRIIKWGLISLLFPLIALAQHERSEYWQAQANIFKQEVHSTDLGQVIFLGNSITEGFDLDKYFPTFKFINRGISGDHIDGLLERLDYSVKQLNPSKLFIMIGINDIGAGDPDSVILGNYQKLLKQLHDEIPFTKVYVQSILPTTERWSNCPKDKIIRLNDKIQRYAEDLKFTWINLYPYYVNQNNYLMTLFTNDGLHLNEGGYSIWSDILKKYLVE